VSIAVSTIDRAKAFYVDQPGFNEDVDVPPERDRQGRPAGTAGIGLLERSR